MRFNADKYFKNKAYDLTEKEREFILDYMNNLQEAYDEAMAHVWINRSDEGAMPYMEIATEARADLRDARARMEKYDIGIEYNWPGHRRKWFFPTYEDALAYEDWLFQCAD